MRIYTNWFYSTTVTCFWEATNSGKMRCARSKLLRGYDHKSTNRNKISGQIYYYIFFCFIYWIKYTHGKFITTIKVTNCYLLNFYVGNTASHLTWQGQDFVCHWCSNNLAKFKSQWRYSNYNQSVSSWGAL